jgi:hypothetical protein
MCCAPLAFWSSFVLTRQNAPSQCWFTLLAPGTVTTHPGVAFSDHCLITTVLDIVCPINKSFWGAPKKWNFDWCEDAIRKYIKALRESEKIETYLSQAQDLTAAVDDAQTDTPFRITSPAQEIKANSIVTEMLEEVVNLAKQAASKNGANRANNKAPDPTASKEINKLRHDRDAVAKILRSPDHALQKVEHSAQWNKLFAISHEISRLVDLEKK